METCLSFLILLKIQSEDKYFSENKNEIMIQNAIENHLSFRKLPSNFKAFP